MKKTKKEKEKKEEEEEEEETTHKKLKEDEADEDSECSMALRRSGIDGVVSVHSVGYCLNTCTVNVTSHDATWSVAPSGNTAKSTISPLLTDSVSLYGTSVTGGSAYGRSV